jgi:hypothetical protein
MYNTHHFLWVGEMLGGGCNTHMEQVRKGANGALHINGPSPDHDLIGLSVQQAISIGRAMVSQLCHLNTEKKVASHFTANM